MRNSQRVIQLAYERALFKFSALGRRSVQDATQSLEKSLTAKGAGGDYRLRQSAQQFLLQHGDHFLVQLEAFFRDNLQRAMRTMYKDLRRDIGSMSADNLSLIDDETINRNMDVDRLVQRMRDVDPLSQGRLNIMIAQLHGEHEVRERENPFRPYLLARSLYEVLWAAEPETQVADVLFEHLSNAMVQQLPDFYSSIGEVFESSGVQARLLARPATLSRMQRLELAQAATAKRLAAGGQGGVVVIGDAAAQQAPLAAPINQDVMASLQRMLESMPRAARNDSAAAAPLQSQALQTPQAPQAPLDSQGAQTSSLQDFVSDLFNRNRQSRASFLADDAVAASSPGVHLVDAEVVDVLQTDAAPLAPASTQLVAKLSAFQEIAARGQSISAAIAPDDNQLFAVRDNLGTEKTTTLERVTIDIVASLFAFILEDDQIPPILRVYIGRLQIPFLKAAMLAPDLLRQEEHPARQLLNRMGSLAIGIDPLEPTGRALSDEIARVAARVLNEFYEDTTVFSSCLDELDHFVARQLRHADSETASSIVQIEHEEETGATLLNSTSAVRQLLEPLSINARIADFLLDVWTRVLAHAVHTGTDAADAVDVAATPPVLSIQQACELVPELVWSAQDKNANERSALLGLLPGLINRVKSGLQMIELPEAQCKQALDALFEVHSKILRGTASNQAVRLMSQEDLYLHFATLAPQLTGSVAELADAADVAVEQVAGDDATPDQDIGFDMPPEADGEWLVQMQIGTSIERWSGSEYLAGRLVWASMRRTLFMFKLEHDSAPVVYSSASLVKALREGSVRLVEYASVFDRAVESLLIGTESMAPQRP